LLFIIKKMGQDTRLQYPFNPLPLILFLSFTPLPLVAFPLVAFFKAKEASETYPFVIIPSFFSSQFFRVACAGSTKIKIRSLDSLSG